jgi:hypothetical protein
MSIDIPWNCGKSYPPSPHYIALPQKTPLNTTLLKKVSLAKNQKRLLNVNWLHVLEEVRTAVMESREIVYIPTLV